MEVESEGWGIEEGSAVEEGEVSKQERSREDGNPKNTKLAGRNLDSNALKTPT